MIEITSNMFGVGYYEYKEDIKDVYTYMTPDSDGIMRGDCEDFVITFIEKMVNAGFIKKIQLLGTMVKQKNLFMLGQSF